MRWRKHLPEVSKDYQDPVGGGGVPSAPAESGQSASGGVVMLGADIEIYTGRPLENLASFETRAFEAYDKRYGTTHLALLCGRAAAPRVTALGSYKNLKCPHLLRLVEAGIVNWTPENRQLFAFIFDMPPVKRLLPAGAARGIKIPDERIVSALIQPGVSALSALANADFVHGAMSPENIFMSGANGIETALIGECLTSMPFLRVNAAFETIERAMAQPSGRGRGTIKNDLYTFGASIAVALKGYNPFAGKSLQQIIHDKIEHGSYSCFIGGERLPSALTEFLRGVLHDDEKGRWTLDDVMQWVEGRRLSGKQSHTAMNAARPFVFREQKFWDMRTLAMSFAENVQDAATVMEKDQFDLWIKRNFDDKDTELRLEKIWSREDGKVKERMVANVCMALDPQAPVRYKGLSVFPQGVGAALAQTMAKNEDVQAYAELISMQFLSNWINQRFEEVQDAAGLMSQLEKSRNFITQKMPGYGIERAVYLLNAETVCLSPLLKNYFVLNPGQLLLALEDIAARPDRPETVLDRHMIAFLSVRDAKMVDPHLGHIISHDVGYQTIGLLRTLAAIQRRFQLGPLPALGKWALSLIGPAIDKYNDRDLRKELGQKVSQISDAGNFGQILEVVDSPAVVQDDLHRFSLARHEHVMLMREKQGIERQLVNRRTFGLATGRQVAMLISSVLGILCILMTALGHFLGT